MSYSTSAAAQAFTGPAWPLRHPGQSASLGILMVEDDASDVALAEAALDSAAIEYELRTLEDGRDVLPYLRRQGKYLQERRPDIMLLDLSLPKKDGFEVLAEMVEQPERVRDLPIVILTGDTHCAFLTHSYGLRIAACLTKPCTAETIREAFIAIRRLDKANR